MKGALVQHVTEIRRRLEDEQGKIAKARRDVEKQQRELRLDSSRIGAAIEALGPRRRGRPPKVRAGS
jgi:rRNA pseudouridine-1189 N-methylase Emg1 (Nep1/Mra1 family)